MSQLKTWAKGVRESIVTYRARFRYLGSRSIQWPSQTFQFLLVFKGVRMTLLLYLAWTFFRQDRLTIWITEDLS